MTQEKDFRLDAVFLNNVNRANLILLSNYPTKTVDAVFFHDRSYGDYTNLFEKAAEFYHSDTALSIATPNTDGARFGGNIPGEASPGKEWVVQRLLEQQIPLQVILHPDNPSHHTLEENDSFLGLSKRMAWRSGVILTQPHQLLRAMLGMVLVMNKTGYQMEIYTTAPHNTPWYEVVRGSQGLEAKPRLRHIDDELDRVYRYQQKGDLASFEELFAYLESRDRGSIRFTKRDLPPYLRLV